jgi:hypothetical protein
MPAPSSESPDRPATPPLDETALLVLSKDHGWVEAWYDTQNRVWQAMDAQFTIDDKAALAWQPLPVMTDEMLDALRATVF